MFDAVLHREIGFPDHKNIDLIGKVRWLPPMVSLQARRAFKPFSNRRVSLSLHSSARTGSTDPFSKAATRSSAKCSAGSHVFSAVE